MPDSSPGPKVWHFLLQASHLPKGNKTVSHWYLSCWVSCLTCQGSCSLDTVLRSMKKSMAQAGDILCSSSEPRWLHLTQGLHVHLPIPERCSLDGCLIPLSSQSSLCLTPRALKRSFLASWIVVVIREKYPAQDPQDQFLAQKEIYLPQSDKGQGIRNKYKRQRMRKKGNKGKSAGLFVLEDKGLPLDREETEADSGL